MIHELAMQNRGAEAMCNAYWDDDKGPGTLSAFPTYRDGQEVLELAEQGFPWQASVGIWQVKIRSLKNEKESAVGNGQEISGPAKFWLEAGSEK
jgi:hypothetical protein